MATDPTTEDSLIVTITLDPDSFECPACGMVCVPTDTRQPAPRDDHRCAKT
jgi:hypothetical protein